MKKWASVVVASTLAFSLLIDSASAKTFTDVKTTNTFYQTIHTMSEIGIIHGYNNQFSPTASIERQHAAAMIYRASTKGLVDLTPIRENVVFKDVPISHSYYEEISALYRAGIIDGYNGNFDPKGKLTRGQMAKIIAQTFNYDKVQTNKFHDVPADYIFNGYIGALVQEEVTMGYTDGTFKPNTIISREHFSAFVYRALGFEKSKMTVHFLDVGQGDSIFIQTRNGKNMLIDGGIRSVGPKIVHYLKSLGVKKIDYVVATHPDADHIGGLIDVFEAFEVKNVWNSGKEHTTQIYEDFLTAALNEPGVKYLEPKVGTSVVLDKDTLGENIAIKVMYADNTATENNDSSLVLKMSHGEVDVLFMGDTGTEIENRLTNVSAEVLKAGHHGSSTSSSLSFLQKVLPKDVILSYGKDNNYGHPNSSVVSNIKKVGAKAYSTAQSGDIVVTSDGVTHKVGASEYTGSGGTNSNNGGTTNRDPSSGYYVIPGAPTSFDNCSDMRKYYPKGVHSSHPAYASKHDRDKDNWACEQN